MARAAGEVVIGRTEHVEDGRVLLGLGSALGLGLGEGYG